MRCAQLVQISAVTLLVGLLVACGPAAAPHAPADKEVSQPPPPAARVKVVTAPNIEERKEKALKNPRSNWAELVAMGSNDFRAAQKIINDYPGFNLYEKDRAIRDLAKDIGYNHLEKVVSLISELPSADAKNEIAQIVTLHWAETDSSALLAYAGKLAPGELKNYSYKALVSQSLKTDSFQDVAALLTAMPFSAARSSVISDASRIWSEKDINGALLWANSLSLSEDRRAAMLSAIPAIAIQKGATTLAEVANLSDDNSIKIACIQAMANLFPADIQAQKASEWVSSLPANLQSIAVSELLAKHGINNPNEWGELISSLKNQGQRQAEMNNFVTMIAQSDPQKAATFVMNISTPREQEAGIDILVNKWYDVDSVALSSWIYSLSKGRVQDAALVKLAGKLLLSDDKEAAQEVVGDITDIRLKNKITKQVSSFKRY